MRAAAGGRAAGSGAPAVSAGRTAHRRPDRSAAAADRAGHHRPYAAFPFPILGIDSDNGSEFINWEQFRGCQQHDFTSARPESGNKNDVAHVEQMNWGIVRQVVGYHRYGTAAELVLLNLIPAS